jgi:hypothetical protein
VVLESGPDSLGKRQFVVEVMNVQRIITFQGGATNDCGRVDVGIELCYGIGVRKSYALNTVFSARMYCWFFMFTSSK